MRIRLDKAFILKLYCYSFQAERSLAFALGANWADLRDYYHGPRIEGVRLLSASVYEALARREVSSPAPTREEVGRTVPFLSLFRYLFGKWITRWRKAWSFPSRELCFMATALASLVHMLDTAIKPDQDKLIALRMDMCLCRSIIEQRCYGLAEIKRARWLEHFWQADWIKPVRMADILGQPPQEGHSARRSA